MRGLRNRVPVQYVNMTFANVRRAVDRWMFQDCFLLSYSTTANYYYLVGAVRIRLKRKFFSSFYELTEVGSPLGGYKV